MGCPPSSGAVHEMVSVVAVFDVTVMLVGAAGVVAGATVIAVVDVNAVPLVATSYHFKSVPEATKSAMVLLPIKV